MAGGHRAVAAGQFAGTPISGGASAPFTAQSDTTEDYALTESDSDTNSSGVGSHIDYACGVQAVDLESFQNPTDVTAALRSQINGTFTRDVAGYTKAVSVQTIVQDKWNLVNTPPEDGMYLDDPVQVTQTITIQPVP